MNDTTSNQSSTEAFTGYGFGASGFVIPQNELAAIVSGLLSLTYLAPTASAIAALDPSVVGSFDSDSASGNASASGSGSDSAGGSGSDSAGASDSATNLGALIRQHILAGAFTSSQLAAQGTVTTAGNTLLLVDSFGGQVYCGPAALTGDSSTINWSTLTATGAVVGEHHVHSIDRVLFPSKVILETLKRQTAFIADKSQGYGTLVALIEALPPGVFSPNGSAAQTMTILAPNDAAFAADPTFDLAQALAPDGVAGTLSLLSKHALLGAHKISAALQAGTLPDLSGNPVVFGSQGSQVTIGAVPLLRANLLCPDGMVHGIGGLIG